MVLAVGSAVVVEQGLNMRGADELGSIIVVNDSKDILRNNSDVNSFLVSLIIPLLELRWPLLGV